MKIVFKAIIAALLFLGAMGPCMAGPLDFFSPSSKPATEVANVDIDASSIISQMYENFKKPITNFGGKVSGGGIALIVALLALHVAVGGIQLAGGTTDAFELAVKGLKLAFVGGLLVASITPQAWLGFMTGLGGETTLPMAIHAGFLKLIGMIQGDTVSADAGSMIAKLAQSLFSAIFKMAEMKVVDSSLGFGDLLANIVGLLLALCMWMFSVIAFIIAGAVILGEAMASDLTIALAIAMTPLMVPWALFRPMEFLFNAWLKTLLIGHLGFIIASFFSVGMGEFAKAALEFATKIPPNQLLQIKTVVSLFGPLLLGSVIMVVIASKVANIAAALISGGGMDGISIHAFRHATGAVGAGPSAAGAAGRGAVGGVSKGAQGVAVGANKVAAMRDGMKNTSGTSTGNSAGSQAAAGVAKTEGKSLTAVQSKGAAKAANSAYNKAIFAGGSRETAKAAANTAASAHMKTIPRSASSASRPTPSSAAAAPSAAPARQSLAKKLATKA